MGHAVLYLLGLVMLAAWSALVANAALYFASSPTAPWAPAFVALTSQRDPWSETTTTITSTTMTSTTTASPATTAPQSLFERILDVLDPEAHASTSSVAATTTATTFTRATSSLPTTIPGRDAYVVHELASLLNEDGGP